MLNMIRMELYRMFKTKSLYVIWLVLAAGILFTTGLSADEMKTYTMEEKQEMYEYATGQQKSDTVNLGMDVTVPTKPGDTVSVFDLFYGNIKGKFLALFMVIFGSVIFHGRYDEWVYQKYCGAGKRPQGTRICKRSVSVCLHSFNDADFYRDSDDQQCTFL